MDSTQAEGILSLHKKNLSFASLLTMASRSFETSKSSNDAIKFSMEFIAAEQSKVGGLSNQLQKIVRNLS